MSFARVPDSLVAYATYELAQMLAVLSPAQREAIARIVQHVYIDNRPWAALFQGDDKICAETTYYRKGVLDSESGSWKRQGWAHQKKFQKALDKAKDLALAAQQAEETSLLRKATVKARKKAEGAVDVWVTVMECEDAPARDRNDAAGRVLDLAFAGRAGQGAGEPAVGDNDDDWWAAALDEKVTL